MYVAPGQGPFGGNVFINMHLLSFRYFKFFQFNDFVTGFPANFDGQSLPCHKIGQGLPRVIIYINFVDPQFQTLHAKFLYQQKSVLKKKILKVFTIYSGHGGHLGHVIRTVYANILAPSTKKTPNEIWLWSTKLFQRRRYLKIMVIYMYIVRGQGQTNSCSIKVFINMNLLSILSFAASFSH